MQAGAGRTVGRNSSWDAVRRLRTRNAILKAASELNRQGRAITIGALARKAGFDPGTVSRYFPRPEDALRVAMPSDFVANVFELLMARPPGEPVLLAVGMAVREATRRLTPEEEDQLRERAEQMFSSHEGWLLGMDSYAREWRPMLLEALTKRAGRDEPGLEERLAVDLVQALRETAMVLWRQEGYRRRLCEVVDEFAPTMARLLRWE
jgi:AcrR family transcriptional regulator